MKSPRALRFFLDGCMHAQRRQGIVYTLNLWQLFNQSPASKYPPHLPLSQPNSLSRRIVTKTRTDGHTTPLQIIMHILIRLERLKIFFYGRMISFLLASLIIIFLELLLTCYSLLQPPLRFIITQEQLTIYSNWLLYVLLAIEIVHKSRFMAPVP